MRVQISPVDAPGGPGQAAQHIDPVTQLHNDERARQIIKGKTGMQIFDNEQAAGREMRVQPAAPRVRIYRSDRQAPASGARPESADG